MFHQAPTDDEQDEGFGNPDIKTERAIHYSAGAEYRLLNRVLIDATVFYNDLGSLVASSNRVIERDGELVDERYNNRGEGRVYGADLLIRHELADNFFGWLAYTLSRAERRDPGANDYRLFDYDQTHILTLVGSYRLPHNWEVGIRWRLTSGNPDTPITGGVYSADDDHYDRILGAYNSVRNPSFHQLDVRLDKRWVYDNWMFNAYIDIQNTYNRGNPEGNNYNFDFSEKEAATGMPLLTIVGLRAEF